MQKDMIPGTVTYQIFVDKLGGKDVNEFVGDEGMIFYDPTAGDLRISDDETPGGIPLLSAMSNMPANNTVMDANGNPVPLPGANTTNVVYNYSQLEAQGILNFGNVKSGFQGVDHFGWILLDGRATSTLTANQQTVAAQLGWGANIPDATGALAKMTSETPGTLNGVFGNARHIITRNLPNDSFTGSTDTEVFRAEDHAGATAGFDGVWLRTGDPSANNTRDSHNHNFNFQLNTQTQIAFDFENRYMALNTFVYLGL